MKDDKREILYKQELLLSDLDKGNFLMYITILLHKHVAVQKVLFFFKGPTH